MHWNCDKYADFADAANKPDGLAVIGVLIQVSLMVDFRSPEGSLIGIVMVWPSFAS